MDLGISLYEYCLTHGEEALLRQWHPEKNAPLTSQTITYGSKRKIWWRCEKGHSWQAQIKSRVNGCGYPVCAGHVKAAKQQRYQSLARPMCFPAAKAVFNIDQNYEGGKYSK